MIKQFSIIAIFSLSLFAFDYNLKPKKVSDDIHCFFGKSEFPTKENGGNMVNSCFVVMSDYVVLIDSGSSYNYAKEVNKNIKKITSKKVKFVINTHYHDDHLMGNGYWKESGASIIAHKYTKEMYQKDSSSIGWIERLISKDAFANSKVVMADIDVEDSYKFDGIEILKLSKNSHTPADIVISIPSKNVIFVGDIVVTNRLPVLKDGDINGWIEALEKLEKFDTKFIIGGHGEDLSKNSIKFTKDYITKLRDSVKIAIENGAELVNISSIVKLDDYKNIPLYEPVNKENIYKAYQLLEFE